MSTLNDELSRKVMNLFWSYQQLADLMPADESGARLLVLLNSEFERLVPTLAMALAEPEPVPELPLSILKSVNL